MKNRIKLMVPNGITGKERVNLGFACHPQSLSEPNFIRAIKSRRMRWAEYVARMKERGIAYSVLVGKHEGQGILGRPRLRYEDNVKMNLREI
jgi:hypothetical protein